MAELRYDEEATRQLLAMYVTGDVVEQRKTFLRALNPQSGESILDIGSGPGFLAQDIAAAAGQTGAVRGIDISSPMVELARDHCKHLPWVSICEADATNLPFEDSTFNAAISTQVLEYVPDVDAALAEIRRVLQSDGRAVIVDTDWDSIVWHSNDRHRMDQVLAAWEHHATDPRLPRTLSKRLCDAGFVVESQQVVPLLNPAFDPNTYSNKLIDLVVSFVAGTNLINLIGTDELNSWANQLRDPEFSDQYFFSLNRYLFIASKRA